MFTCKTAEHTVTPAVYCSPRDSLRSPLATYVTPMAFHRSQKQDTLIPYLSEETSKNTMLTAFHHIKLCPEVLTGISFRICVARPTTWGISPERTVFLLQVFGPPLFHRMRLDG